MANKILLIGGGGHCRSVIDVIELQGKFNIIGIIDDQKEKVGKKVFKYPIIGTAKDLLNLRKEAEYALVTIGHIHNVEPRKRIFNLLKELNYKIPVIISPLAYVSKYSFIDEGTIVMHNVIINSNVKIGKNCIINTKALIEHDCEVGDNCHISTGAILNGAVKVGSDTFIGSGAICIQGITINQGSFIKAGSLVKE
jgi:sugar O-acyltransferase (sialic acid O-acetyltransferase NeuD family)